MDLITLLLTLTLLLLQDTPRLTGWARSAMSLLIKVWEFRGANRAKSDINASDWFIEPVSEVEVPDYYDIVENPMDFSTIKGIPRRHAAHQKNCEKYNPPGDKIRRDCEEVFVYYMKEYGPRKVENGLVMFNEDYQ